MAEGGGGFGVGVLGDSFWGAGEGDFGGRATEAAGLGLMGRGTAKAWGGGWMAVVEEEEEDDDDEWCWCVVDASADVEEEEEEEEWGAGMGEAAAGSGESDSFMRFLSALIWRSE